MAEGFLYNGADPSLSDRYPNVEVTGLPVVVRWAGPGCAELQMLVSPRVKPSSDPCCLPPAQGEIWTTFRNNGCKTVMCDRKNQLVLSVPGTYRFEVCHPDVSTVMYYEEVIPPQNLQLTQTEA